MYYDPDVSMVLQIIEVKYQSSQLMHTGIMDHHPHHPCLHQYHPVMEMEMVVVEDGAMEKITEVGMLHCYRVIITTTHVFMYRIIKAAPHAYLITTLLHL